MDSERLHQIYRRLPEEEWRGGLRPPLNPGTCPEDEEEEECGHLDSERLRQSYRRLPEEKLRGELFGIRTTLLNPGACPED